MLATNANNTENRWYWRRFLDTLRADAPGRTNNEFRIKRPTQEIAKVTTTAMADVNMVWVNLVLMPRDEARYG